MLSAVVYPSGPLPEFTEPIDDKYMYKRPWAAFEMQENFEVSKVNLCLDSSLIYPILLLQTQGKSAQGKHMFNICLGNKLFKGL